MDAALAMLGRRRYSTPRLRKKLVEKFKNTDLDYEAVIVRLTELRLLDDRDYADAFVRDKMRQGRHGRHTIESALLAEGLPRDMVGEAVADGVGVEEEYAQAETTLARYLRRARKEGRELRQAAYTHLRSRGFSDEIVAQVLRTFPEAVG